MSFNSLPTEIKQLIVSHTHEMDTKWRKRQAEIKAAGSSTVKNWKVKGIDAFSKVSKECRELSLRYLITTLKASTAQDPIFESCILGTPLAELITTFRIEQHTSLDSLSTIVQYILPRLPNLRRIHVPHYRPLAILSPVNTGRAEPRWDRQPFVLRTFAEFVRKQITEWDVEITPKIDLASLVLSSPSTLRSLTIRSSLQNQSYIVETADSPLATLLINCSCLETLKIVSRATPTSSQATLPFVHPLVISARYPCYHTLTSLSLSVGKGTSAYIDISALHFAGEFQHLTHLHLEGPFAISTTSPTYVLRCRMPQLQHLELIVEDLESVEDVLNALRLPLIQRIDITFPDSSDAIAREAHQSPSTLQNIVDEILAYSKTLRYFTLDSSVGLYQDDLDYLSSFLSRTSIIVETTWRLGAAETRALSDRQLLDSDDEEVPSSSTLLEVVGGSIRETSEWVVKEVELIENEGDLHGMKSLVGALSKVRDLRDYLDV